MELNMDKRLAEMKIERGNTKHRKMENVHRKR